MSNAGCDRVDERGAWVLGALPEAEESRYREHLESCAACQAEVVELQQAADLLADVRAPVPVAPELEAELMAVVRDEAQLLRMASTPAAGARAPGRDTSVARIVAVLAAALVLVAAGIGIGTLLDDEPTAERLPEATERLVVRATNAKASLQRSGAVVLLRLDDLDSPDRGRIYQVWLRRPGRPLASTNRLFSVSDGGQAIVALPALRGVEEIVVTAEPPTGSRSPTLPPVAIATRAGGRRFS